MTNDISQGAGRFLYKKDKVRKKKMERKASYFLEHLDLIQTMKKIGKMIHLRNLNMKLEMFEFLLLN